GRLAWGIQFHIETTPAIVRQWADEDAAELLDYDVERILSRSDAVHAELEATWRPFAQAFVAVLADPGSVAAPTASISTAAPVTGPAASRAGLAAEASAARGGPSALGMPQLRPPGHD